MGLWLVSVPARVTRIHLLRADPGACRIKVQAADKLRYPSEMAGALGALAAVNGGLFSAESGEPVDFEMSGGRISHPRHPRNPRSLVAFSEDAVFFGRFKPGPDRGEAPEGIAPSDWLRVSEALAAGPRLIQGGRIPNLAKAEGFPAAYFKAQPRTALGLDSQGRILILVAEGRRPGRSVGLTLSDLADFLKSEGAVEALNLDGGGSSVLILGGKVASEPSDWNPLTGRSMERPVANIVALLKR